MELFSYANHFSFLCKSLPRSIEYLIGLFIRIRLVDHLIPMNIRSTEPNIHAHGRKVDYAVSIASLYKKSLYLSDIATLS